MERGSNCSPLPPKRRFFWLELKEESHEKQRFHAKKTLIIPLRLQTTVEPANAYIRLHNLSYMCSLFRGFSIVGTENRVHCSELGGVHCIEVYLQQKLIGRTDTCVHIGGVH